MRVSLFIFTLVSPSSEATIHPVHSPATARSFTPHLCVVQLSRCPKKYRRTSDCHCCSPFTVLSIPCPSPSSSTSLCSGILSLLLHHPHQNRHFNLVYIFQFDHPPGYILNSNECQNTPSFKLTNKMPQEIEREESTSVQSTT